MFKYKLGEDIFNVPAEEVDIFEAETPDAVRITDEITHPEEDNRESTRDYGITLGKYFFGITRSFWFYSRKYYIRSR